MSLNICLLYSWNTVARRCVFIFRASITHQLQLFLTHTYMANYPRDFNTSCVSIILYPPRASRFHATPATSSRVYYSRPLAILVSPSGANSAMKNKCVPRGGYNVRRGEGLSCTYTRLTGTRGVRHACVFVLRFHVMPHRARWSPLIPRLHHRVTLVPYI